MEVKVPVDTRNAGVIKAYLNEVVRLLKVTATEWKEVKEMASSLSWASGRGDHVRGLKLPIGYVSLYVWEDEHSSTNRGTMLEVMLGDTISSSYWGESHTKHVVGDTVLRAKITEDMTPQAVAVSIYMTTILEAQKNYLRTLRASSDAVKAIRDDKFGVAEELSEVQ